MRGIGTLNYIGTIENDRRIIDAKQIIIYGGGKVGRHALEVLCERGVRDRVVCFCDNNPNLLGKEVEGIPVFSVSDVCCSKYPQGTYLVASMCVRQMVESLMQYGIEDIHIIRES